MKISMKFDNRPLIDLLCGEAFCTIRPEEEYPYVTAEDTVEVRDRSGKLWDNREVVGVGHFEYWDRRLLNLPGHKEYEDKDGFDISFHNHYGEVHDEYVAIYMNRRRV